MKRSHFFNVFSLLSSLLLLNCNLTFASNSFLAYATETWNDRTPTSPVLSTSESGNRLDTGGGRIYESGYRYRKSTFYSALNNSQSINMITLLLGKRGSEMLSNISLHENIPELSIEDFYCKDCQIDYKKLQTKLAAILSILDRNSGVKSMPNFLNNPDVDMKELTDYLKKINEQVKDVLNMLKLELLDQYDKAHKVYCRQMAKFYYFLTERHHQGNFTEIPEWNTVPAAPGNESRFTTKYSDSATHTEFMMVYQILKDSNRMSLKSDGSLSMDSSADLDLAVEILRGGGVLPTKIYSQKAMCPVCEAFLTSLYNVCGTQGTFVYETDPYKSGSGTNENLKKISLKQIISLAPSTPPRSNGYGGPNTGANGKGTAVSSTGPSFGAPPSKERVEDRGRHGTGIHDKKSNNSKAQRYNKPNSLGSSRSGSLSRSGSWDYYKSRQERNRKRDYQDSRDRRSRSRSRSRSNHRHNRSRRSYHDSSDKRILSRSRSRSNHRHNSRDQNVHSKRHRDRDGHREDARHHNSSGHHGDSTRHHHRHHGSSSSQSRSGSYRHSSSKHKR